MCFSKQLKLYIMQAQVLSVSLSKKSKTSNPDVLVQVGDKLFKAVGSANVDDTTVKILLGDEVKNKKVKTAPAKAEKKEEVKPVQEKPAEKVKEASGEGGDKEAVKTPTKKSVEKVVEPTTSKKTTKAKKDDSK